MCDRPNIGADIVLPAHDWEWQFKNVSNCELPDWCRNGIVAIALSVKISKVKRHLVRCDRKVVHKFMRILGDIRRENLKQFHRNRHSNGWIAFSYRESAIQTESSSGWERSSGEERSSRRENLATSVKSSQYLNSLVLKRTVFLALSASKRLLELFRLKELKEHSEVKAIAKNIRAHSFEMMFFLCHTVSVAHTVSHTVSHFVRTVWTPDSGAFQALLF